MIEQALFFLKGVVPAVVSAVLLFFGYWAQMVYRQKQKNEVKEIDLSAKKISLDISAKPIDDLVSASNDSHGANEVVDDSGDDSKKK